MSILNKPANIVITSLRSGRIYRKQSGFLADRLLEKFHKAGLYGMYDVHIDGELHARFELSPNTATMTTIGVYS